MDDLTAWCLLAVAIAFTRTNSFLGAIPTILEAAIYIGLMLTIGRKFLKRLAKHYQRTGRLSQFIIHDLGDYGTSNNFYDFSLVGMDIS